MDIIDADTVTEPGFYRMAAEAYHADPCEQPSLSNSIAKLMLGTCPRKAWEKHPRLNPNPEPDEPSDILDFGTLVHCLLLGKGRDIVIVDAADWRTKAAREAREQACAAGKVACLAHKHEQAVAMADAVFRKMARRDEYAAAFDQGEPELVMAWRDGPTWCRSLVDWIEPRRSDGRVVVYDLKTTGKAAAPHGLDRVLGDGGYEMQAAFITAGVEALIPDAAGQVVVRFVVVENEPPHLATVAELSPPDVALGLRKMRAARRLWQRCLDAGYGQEHWPGYPDDIVTVELPGWCEASWSAREMFDPTVAPSDEPGGEAERDDGPFTNYLAAG